MIRETRRQNSSQRFAGGFGYNTVTCCLIFSMGVRGLWFSRKGSLDVAHEEGFDDAGGPLG